ncbi:helix-turn-helix transcriptional regulator [Corynebacterium sp. 335C]
MRPNLVRKLRRWHELSQADLAGRVGVSRQTIANIERGNYSPSVHLALDICTVFGATVEEVFGDGAAEHAGPPAGSTPRTAG